MHPLSILEHLPWQVGAAILVLTFVTITILGMVLVRRRVSIGTLRAHHDVAGFVFTNLGTLYAVLLGFTVVNVQQRFDKLRDNIQMEASSLAELYRDAAVFSAEDKASIRSALIAYTRSVLNDEWGTMESGLPSEATTKALNEIWKIFYSIDPKGARQQAWYSEAISRLNTLVNTRLARLMGSRESLGTEMWTLLLIGAVVMMCFNWFFGLESIVSHLLIASVLAATTAFLLFLIYSLDTAFIGGVSIPPEALVHILETFQDIPT